MDAKEFLKEWKRVCVKHGNCRRCPIFKGCYAFVSPLDLNDLGALVSAVKKWSEEHPKEEVKK